MKIVGLTGSIAMGKSTAANLFRDLGFPVFDADQAVHRLYAAGGAAVAAVAAEFPQAIADGAVDRTALSRIITADPGAIRRIEAIVHPLVRDLERRFLDQARSSGAPLAVLDIPLLFETGRDRDVDVIVVVSAPAAVQRARALERPGMTAEKFEAIVANQLSDRDKQQRADYVIDTGASIESARKQLKKTIIDILSNSPNKEI